MSMYLMSMALTPRGGTSQFLNRNIKSKAWHCGCMYGCVYVCKHLLSFYVCMYACMYVCVHVCINLCIACTALYLHFV